MNEIGVWERVLTVGGPVVAAMFLFAAASYILFQRIVSIEDFVKNKLSDQLTKNTVALEGNEHATDRNTKAIEKLEHSIEAALRKTA